MSECACGQDWRIVACNIKTGQERAVLHPVACDWQTTLNRVGQGTLTLATKAVRAQDIWPHLTSIYILRTAGGSATPENPVVEFAGLIESFSASDNGATSVGMQSIEKYLHHRMIRSTKVFFDAQQTVIARELVKLAAADGIPLTAVAEASAYRRDRTYYGYNRPFIGPAVENLSNLRDGIDWELSHSRSSTGRWTTTMIFRDHVGEDRGVVLRSDREAFGYGLDVDATDQATFVDGIGAGEENAQQTFHAEDELVPYPRFDAAPAWKEAYTPDTPPVPSGDPLAPPEIPRDPGGDTPDIPDGDPLRGRTVPGRVDYSGLIGSTEGYLDAHMEPVAIPSVTLRGLDPDPAMIRLGDRVQVQSNFGSVTYNGDARILSISWALGADEPATRTFEMVPRTRASSSVLNQIPTDDCEDC